MYGGFKSSSGFAGYAGYAGVEVGTYKEKSMNISTAVPTKRMMGLVHKAKNCRLGDLLVASGIITLGQLGVALQEQQYTKEQLGKILIRQGTISAVQLARQLAGQWCIRAFAVGITFVIQTTAPTIAHADDHGASYPELLGVHEVRSDDLSSFGKWSVLFKRFEEPLRSINPASAGIAEWRAEIQSLRGLPRHEQVERINDFLNKIIYVDDRKQYGENGYWGATPERFLSGGGDCKDYALMKYASLQALGFSPDQMRVAVVRDKIENIPHAILIVNEDSNSYILDNQNKNIEFISDVHRYQPIFSINSRSWWLQKAT
jgi:predicted transglutaminase-like cysteine proteinase